MEGDLLMGAARRLFDLDGIEATLPHKESDELSSG
jgi:hypothetical protein